MSPDNRLKISAAFGLCPFFSFYVGTGDTATRSPSLIKGVFRALGRMGKGSGGQLVFSLIFRVMGRDTESKRHVQNLAPGFALPPELCFLYSSESL